MTMLGSSWRVWRAFRCWVDRLALGGFAYHCKECHQTYIRETKKTLKVRLSEHKQAVKRGDPKNGIAVHAHESSHMIDWDGARVRRSGMIGYWQRRTI